MEKKNEKSEKRENKIKTKRKRQNVWGCRNLVIVVDVDALFLL